MGLGFFLQHNIPGSSNLFWQNISINSITPKTKSEINFSMFLNDFLEVDKLQGKVKDTRQLVLDFSKLVMGDAENKLFVGPFTDENEKILEIFKKIAVNCKGNVWLALIPHPEEWEHPGVNKNKGYLQKI